MNASVHHSAWTVETPKSPHLHVDRVVNVQAAIGRPSRKKCVFPVLTTHRAHSIGQNRSSAKATTGRIGAKDEVLWEKPRPGPRVGAYGIALDGRRWGQRNSALLR